MRELKDKEEKAKKKQEELLELEPETEEEKYTFEFAGDKAVKEVQITFLDAKSTSDVKNMLTLAELELSNLSNTPVTGITADPNNAKEMYVGTLADINATVQPDNATTISISSSKKISS